MSDRIVREVDALMEAVLRRAGTPEPLYNMMAYHLGWQDDEGSVLPPRQRSRFGGKKMRAVLCALSCEAAGGKAKTAIPAAVAVELVQNFSLVHDDIEDGDAERRHRPTVWMRWGIPQAINTGSAMQALVNTAVLQTNAPADTVLDLMSALTGAMVEMTEGQHLDIAFQTRDDVTVPEYEDMAARKTGALMEAAAYAGARLATDDAKALSHWRAFGRAFGRAFQAQDDLLGVVGQPALTGKPVGNDIRARKKALPLLHALAHSGPGDLAIIRDSLREEPVSDAGVLRVTAILERSGALDATRRAVDAATQLALMHFEKARPVGPAAGRLREMALKAIGRTG